MKRTAIFYLVTLAIAAVCVFAMLHYGATLAAPHGLRAPSVAPATGAMPAAFDSMVAGLREHAEQPLSRLFVQLLIIIVASRLMGMLFARCGQPAVVGEMAAGILLGPSLFGWLAPDVFQGVFPADSLGTIKLLSQVGVCLFMFAVGMEVDAGHVRNKARTAVMISHASMVFPFLLGMALACLLYTRLAQPGAGFTAFALFMGISMSITAFPVLARILQERELTRTALGGTAITCAAIGDVTAWSALAFVVAIAQATSMSASVLNLVLVAVFIVVIIGGVRPALARWLGKGRLADEEPSKGVLAMVLCVVVAASLVTEVIGIHALFGAFLAGAIMPDTGGFRHKLSVRIENFSSVLLLPLFFVFIGLRTQVGLLNDWGGWLLCLGIIVVATVGKLGGTALTARWTGMPWSESLQLGALMNTRGLMELIVLNMGYDLGILSPRIFAMLVIMALATTMLTGPLLTLFGSRELELEKGTVPSTS